MGYIKYILCVLMSMNLEALTNKKCPDCTNIVNCDSAKAAVFNNVQKIREAFCGFNDLGTMVCCSYFLDVTESAINNHPNVNLLPNVCGEMDISRTVGGLTGFIYEFPWMALISSRLRTATFFHCTGTIINSRYILTTAKCIIDRNIFGVRIGEFNLTSTEDCAEDITGETICESHIQDIRVEQAIYHEKFEKKPPFNYDIGLIRLASPIDFSYRNAAPICLPRKTEPNNNIANKTAIVTGWGLADTISSTSVLTKRLVYVYSDDVCRQVHTSSPEDPPNFGHNQYCGRTLMDSCNSDAGSPLLIYELNNNHFKYIQYGIVSYGPRNCRTKDEMMYTAIPPYMTWILNHIRE